MTVLKAVQQYAVFFLVVAFVITCCTMLFVSTLSETLQITFTDENLSAAAKLTFLNVLLLSLIFTLFDAVRRKITVDRPVREIQSVLQKLKAGEFHARAIPSGRQDHFDQIAEDINALAKELSGVETLRTDFIANVSHELKTPLSVIRNYAAMLQQPELSEERRLEYAGAAADAAGRLAELVTNILRLSKLENQQIYPRAETYDLGEQLCESLLQFEHIWETQNISIKTQIGEDVMICADAELLSLVWNNLLSNAFKFTRGGGTVSLSLTADETHAIVTVADTGCGMSAEVGAHIFEKFYQADISHAARGNGLGLALVKRVIDITRGEISVQSAPGEGSTFTVRIRRMPDAMV